jgi:hypothetical protein
MELMTAQPPTKRGHNSMVLCKERISKMVHATHCIKTVTAKNLAELFEQEGFKHHVLLKDIVSD